MASYSNKVETLKTVLSTGTEFGKVFHHFFDHLGADPGFLDAGKRAKNPRLKTIVREAVEKALNEKTEITNLMLIKMAKEKFYHGTCFLNGRMATVLYFEDLDMGMIAISMGLTTGQMSYIRFTSTTIDPEKAAHFAVGESKRLQ